MAEGEKRSLGKQRDAPSFKLKPPPNELVDRPGGYINPKLLTSPDKVRDSVRSHFPPAVGTRK